MCFPFHFYIHSTNPTSGKLHTWPTSHILTIRWKIPQYLYFNQFSRSTNFFFATLCVPLVCWWRRQWGWITRPFHGSPTIGSGQTSDQLLHMPHNCHFYWPTYINLILPHICHFYDDEIISWEPPYWIRPNIWPSSTHASYLSLFRWGQNKGETISVYWMFAATIDQHLHWIVTYIQK